MASLGIPRWISSDSVAPAELGFGSVAEVHIKFDIFASGKCNLMLDYLVLSSIEMNPCYTSTLSTGQKLM